MDTDAVTQYPAPEAGPPRPWPWVRSSTLDERLLLAGRSVLLKRGPRRSMSILAEVRPPTGEPDAGDPHVRFGGRGSHKALPTPIKCPTARARDNLECGDLSPLFSHSWPASHWWLRGQTEREGIQ